MNAVRLLPRGHETFDVHVGFRHLGSVWHTHLGWVAYTPSLIVRSGKAWPTAEDAAAELTGAHTPR